VGIASSDFEGRVEKRETCCWSFPCARHFHSSTRVHAVYFSGRRVPNNLRLASCIRRAHSVSLTAAAIFRSASRL
jgi:hypothetical protein